MAQRLYYSRPCSYHDGQGSMRLLRPTRNRLQEESNPRGGFYGFIDGPAYSRAFLSPRNSPLPIISDVVAGPANYSLVQVHGKGKKLRRCPLWPQTVTELARLIGMRSNTGHVFLNRRGEPITRFGIHTMVERYVQKVSPLMPSLKNKRVSPHTIRHRAT